jgi:hypothetical protein
MIAEELDNTHDEFEQRPLLSGGNRETDGGVLVQPQHFVRFDKDQGGAPIFPNVDVVAGTDRLAQNGPPPQPIILPADFNSALKGFHRADRQGALCLNLCRYGPKMRTIDQKPN